MSAAVVVVVPARDEAGDVARTLHCVQRALTHARRQGLVDRCTVEVCAHRCDDATARVARAALASGAGLVTEDELSETVGAVRHAGALRGLARLDTPPRASWVMSTDADTTVARTWVSQLLAESARARAVGVVGLARLDRWHGGPRALAAYRMLLESRLHHTDGHHQHDHVYGANLAVRADAYLDADGFPAIAHGEDQALVDALDARGHRLLRTRGVEVVTSGRLRGRATHGLAHHLSLLEHE